MLTENTPVPTHARGALRAFIKGQSGFDAWASTQGLASREVLNRHLIQYALAHNLENDVLAILNQPSNLVGSDVFEMPGAATPQAATPQVAALDVAALLDPISAFLSPLVRTELEKTLAPVVAQANKPAIVQTVEKEKIVERLVVQNLAPVAPGALPYAVQGSKVAIGPLFGFKGGLSKVAVSTWESHGASPAVDPFYVVDPQPMVLMATAIERGTNVWLAGPSGSGKSTMPAQFAAVVGRPCVKFGFTKQTEVADLIGGPGVLTDGSTAWQDGSLIQAVKRPGTLIILDELTIAPPGVQAIVQLIADDHRTMTLPTGEVVTCAPGVVFIVADNTRGFGDETGQYHGTHAANAALVNRFKRMLVIDYLSKDQEAKALVNHTGCPRPAADYLADFVHRARKMSELENIVLSLRQMTGFIQTCQDGFTPKVAAQVSFLNALPAAERAALETLFTLAWAQEFGNLMTGTASDATSPSPTPSDSEGSRAFDDEVSATLAR